jgi:upstream activation factor subunit UAF30
LGEDWIRDNKDSLDVIIATVFTEISPPTLEKLGDVNGHGAEPEAGPSETNTRPKKRVQADDDEEDEGQVADVDGKAGEGAAETKRRPMKKVKKSRGGEVQMTDAEYARQLSKELNSQTRSSRSAAAATKTNGSKKVRGTKAKSRRGPISAATVDSEGEGEDYVGKKKKRTGGGGAKGGFSKEYVLSGPLAAVMQVDKLSRPQVVKRLWEYIKGNDLQNPSNKREIVCDDSLRAVFGQDKVDMFKMNKILGDHLHETGA